jgi:hypothetical protein
MNPLSVLGTTITLLTASPVSQCSRYYHFILNISDVLGGLRKLVHFTAARSCYVLQTATVISSAVLGQPQLIPLLVLFVHQPTAAIVFDASPALDIFFSP